MANGSFVWVVGIFAKDLLDIWFLQTFMITRNIKLL